VVGRRYIPIVLAALCLGSCSDHDEDPAIERVLRDARSAVLAGDGAHACRLLTPGGREHARAFDAGPGRAAASCEQVVRRRQALAERDPESSWPEDLRDADIEVLSVDGDRAQAELRVQDQFGTAIRWRIRLRKTGAGWRIDDSNAVPSGG
jgi:hypothetical protein